MQSFLARHDENIKGVLSGFDRVRFRGTLRLVANKRGLCAWLHQQNVLFKDFRPYSAAITDTLREATTKLAERSGKPVEYLWSSRIRKEHHAREIARRDGVTEGLVCILSAVEPCKTFKVRKNRAAKELEMQPLAGKCLHYYFYLIDPRIGWLNIRLQTWFPFTAQIVINGREWLARQMQRAGIAFERRENCFVDIADVARAQRLMNRQLKTDWSRLLDRLLFSVHRSHRTLFGPDELYYYWSADETEWATDVMFRSPEALRKLYPRLLRHAVTTFGGNDVLRFLGRRPSVTQLTAAELVTHFGVRAEGARIKHSLDRNSIKMYDKQTSALRIETTVNNARQMRSYRASEADPDGPKSWRGLRKGVADLYRRAEISQKANERYLEALAAVDSEATLGETTESVCRRTTWKGRSARALNPLSETDAALLAVVNRGEFALLGFRNRDLRSELFGEARDAGERRRQMTKVTRLIRLLRAHGLVQKIPKTHRYKLSERGRETINTLLTARGVSARKLSELAA